MRSFSKSEKMLRDSEEYIPLGSQTFSKSKTQYPYGVSPFFIKEGKGSRVTDVDGNEYIDFVNALASITLGYNDPDVKQAVATQLESGTIFSLASPIELEVAKKLCSMVPCAEKVRFGKNGSDATSGAIRLARAYTGRDLVAVCGYHGWQDWYIGSTARNLGVPEATRNLTLAFEYNNIDSLKTLFEQNAGKIAAVILEPMNVVQPQNDFLNEVKSLAHENGAVLVFDETITGFRFANGGAQELFDVTPDLATFGKGLANGFPLSAVVGKSEIMALMEEVFFSSTFGGETLSLAAALATLNKLESAPVIETLRKRGSNLKAGLQNLINDTGLDDIFSTAGDPTWNFLLVGDYKSQVGSAFTLKTFIMQELHQRGFLSVGTHNMSYAHTEEDVEGLLLAYREIFDQVKGAGNLNDLAKKLRCQPLEPLFKVRNT